MNAPNHDSKDLALSQLLRQTAGKPELPPGFQEQVWRQVVRQSRRERTGFDSPWMEFFTGLLSRPAFAVAALALLVSVSGLSGYHSAAAASREQAAGRYTAVVSPFQRVAR